MDISVKLQQEHVTLIKKAIKLAPCNTEDECTSQKTQSLPAEEVEKVNLQMQKIRMELIQQALTLKTGGEETKAPTKCQWYRTHRDQEQQTDKLAETAEKQAAEGPSETVTGREGLSPEDH